MFSKRVITGISFLLMLSLTACADNKGDGLLSDEVLGTTRPGSVDNDPITSGIQKQNERRVINIASWYDIDYTSDGIARDGLLDKDLEDNMRRIEDEYNVELHVVNICPTSVLGYDNAYLQSLDRSFQTGIPEYDIYVIDPEFGIPRASKGYFLEMSVYTGSGDDAFNDNNIVNKLGIPGNTGFEYYFFRESACSESSQYALGYNVKMLREAGLDSPQDLYDKGEWTWDRFLEYLKLLTKDTNNDGITDVYGYGGYAKEFAKGMLASNGAYIATSSESNLNSPEVVQTLSFIYDIYNKYHIARPWNDDDFDDNNNSYVSEKQAFWITAPWIAANNGDSDLPFEVGIVPFPIGPNVLSGNAEYMAARPLITTYYAIPKGVKDPELVYSIIKEWFNWYRGDLNLIDTTWCRDAVYSPRADNPERNYNYLFQLSRQKMCYDAVLDNGLLNKYKPNIYDVIHGYATPDQFIDYYCEIVAEGVEEWFDRKRVKGLLE